MTIDIDQPATEPRTDPGCLEPVDAPTLLRWLADAGMNATVDDRDGDLYLNAGEVEFPFWVRVEPDQGLICLVTYFKFKPDAELEAALELSNRCNEGVVLPSFWVEGSPGDLTLMANHYICLEGGANRIQVLRMIRRFSGAVRYAGQHLDGDDLLQ